MTQPATVDVGTIPSPLVDPVSWDSVTVAGAVWGPANGMGKVEWKRVKRPYKWQKKDAAGQDGETKTYRGKKPPDFIAEFHMWTDAQFVWWQTFQQAFVYDASKTTVDPTDIYAPPLALVGVSQITVDSLGAPEKQGDRHYWIATVEMCEYFPPIVANVTQTPDGAAVNYVQVSGPTPDPALSQAQQQIAALRQEAEASGALTPGESGLP